jgi:hypothetical protein
MRSSWTDDKAGFVGFKGGDNAASHGHADLGTFVYDADGARWAMDLGADDYNLPAYFGAQRFTYYRTRTEGHNTLTIGTENQNLKGGVAPIVAFSDKAGEAYAVADLTAGYAPKASRVQRGVQLLGRQLLVQDEVDAGEPIDLVWNFHTDAKVTIESNGHFATLTKSGKSVAVRIIEPDDARFAIVSANPPAPQMQQPNVSNLTIRQVGNIKSLRLAVLIAPKSDPLLNVKLRPLAEWDH